MFSRKYILKLALAVNFFFLFPRTIRMLFYESLLASFATMSSTMSENGIFLISDSLYHCPSKIIIKPRVRKRNAVTIPLLLVEQLNTIRTSVEIATVKPWMAHFRIHVPAKLILDVSLHMAVSEMRSRWMFALVEIGTIFATIHACPEFDVFVSAGRITTTGMPSILVSYTF